MTVHERNAVACVFADRDSAQMAVAQLRRAGFRDDQIGVIGPGEGYGATDIPPAGDQLAHTHTGEGAIAGAAVGAGVGALWGLAITAGVLPPLGPAFAAGTLAAVLSSAAAGAAAAGVVGALVGMGIPRDEAEFCERELNGGRTIVSVSAGDRTGEAHALLRRMGGYDSQSAGERSTHRTLDVPVQSDNVLIGRDPAADRRDGQR